MGKKICALAVLMVLLSGCGSLEIEFEKNGEGTFTYHIDKNEYITLPEVEDRINDSIEEANEEAGEEAVSLKEIEETDNYIEAVVEFSHLFFESSNLFASAKDIMRYNPSLLEDLTPAKSRILKRTRISGNCLSFIFPVWTANWIQPFLYLERFSMLKAEQ